VPANGELRLGGKEKELIFHGVNTYSVRELKRIKGNTEIYILKDLNEELLKQSIIEKKAKTGAEKIKQYFELKKASWQILPKGVKRGLITVLLYLLLALPIVVMGSEEIAIRTAFISLVISFLLGPIRLFAEDKIFGSVVACLLSIMVGWFLSDGYFGLINKGIIGSGYLGSHNIGNIMTVIALLISFVGYVRRLFYVCEYEVRNQELKSNKPYK